MKKLTNYGLLFTGSLLLSQTSFAQGLGQKSKSQQLEEMVATASKLEGSLTSVSVGEARELLEQVAGGIGFVEVTDYRDNFTQSLGDTLVFTPGVFADTSAQRENRISIRGSGLNATFERRGINAYRDGVPITRASGITEFQEIDPLSVKYIEIFKGANGIRYGTNALGGAINIVTPTGRNTEAGSSIRAEAGSFSTSRFNLTTVGKTDKLDYYAAITKLDSDGFRAHSDVDSIYAFSNIGFALSDNIETRFYATLLEDDFKLAGGVTIDEALNNPESAVAASFVPDRLSFLGGPGLFSAIDDNWDRNLKVQRIANRTTFAFDAWQLEAGVWAAKRELDHAITRSAGVIDQSEDEVGVSLRASNERSSGNASKNSLIWSLGLTANKSDNDAKVFRNIFGERGAQSSQDQQDAENISLYGQVAWLVTESVDLIIGGQYVHSVRENTHVPLNVSDTEDDSGKLEFDEFSPRIGLLWHVDDTKQVYANLGRASEVPGISDLTSAGVLPFDPLKAQESTTFEIGSRGQAEQWSWDVSLYRSVIENELIDFTNGFVTNTINSVSDTIHQGLELGVDWQAHISVLNQRDIVFTWRNILTYSDFKFDNHPVYGDNTLAGVPESNYLTEFNLASEKWRAGVNLRYVVDGPYADFANTVQTDGYTIVGLNAAWNLNSTLRAFVSLENIGDKKYISNVSTVGQANPTSSLFTPGQGRGVFGGFKYSF